MSLRKNKYRRMPRQGEAVGITHLVYPFAHFWSVIRMSFLLDAVRCLVRGGPIPNLDDLLDEFGFGSGAFNLDEWFQHHQPATLRLPRDAASLTKAGEAAADLARDDGLWKAEVADLDRPAKDACSEIHNRLARIKHHVALKYGPQAVAQVLEEIRGRFRDASRHWNNEPLPGRLAEELQQAAAQLRSYAMPRSWYLNSLFVFGLASLQVGG